MTKGEGNPEAAKRFAMNTGESFLQKDVNGHYAILREEQIIGYDENDLVCSFYSTERIMDADPSDKEIFKYKLKGKCRQSLFRRDKE